MLHAKIPFQPVLENTKEDEVGVKKVLEGEKSEGRRNQEETQLFWLLTSSTELPSSTSLRTTTDHPTLSTSTPMMTQEYQTLQEIEADYPKTNTVLSTTAGPSRSHKIRATSTTIQAISPFSLPFLNNPTEPDLSKEGLEGLSPTQPATDEPFFRTSQSSRFTEGEESSLSSIDFLKICFFNK